MSISEQCTLCGGQLLKCADCGEPSVDLRRYNKELSDNLTSVQKRCTQLLEEVRVLRRRVIELGNEE